MLPADLHGSGLIYLTRKPRSLLKPLIQRTLLNNWMVSIDLMEAYLSVPIGRGSMFAWGDKMYEFQCLPNGLSSVSKIFTRLLKPVMVLLRKRGLQSRIFLAAADG